MARLLTSQISTDNFKKVQDMRKKGPTSASRAQASVASRKNINRHTTSRRKSKRSIVRLWHNSIGAVVVGRFNLKSKRNRRLILLTLVALTALLVGVAFLNRSRASLGDKYLFSGLTPAVVDADDKRPAELGVRFLSTKPGFIRGVRFYKSEANTGVHTGTLWSGTGNRLAIGTFTGETAFGWQRLNFAVPVKITANTAYVVSYHTDSGHYAETNDFFTTDYVKSPLIAPVDSSDAPNGVYAYGRDSSFPDKSHKASNYWVDPIFSPYSTIPTTIFDHKKPGNTNADDARSVELGTVFTTDRTGVVLGIAYYKSSSDSGIHVGTLWDSDGTKLASVTFSNEGVSGWQWAEFSVPVRISVGVTYVVSYHTQSGHYAYDEDFFAAPHDRAPLHAPINAGVRAYGDATIFPQQTDKATNYWVDVWFAADPTSNMPPPPSPVPLPQPPPPSSAPVPPPAPTSGT